MSEVMTWRSPSSISSSAWSFCRSLRSLKVPKPALLKLVAQATIERAANGVATAIVSPFGQRTELAIDPANNKLAAIAYPEGIQQEYAYDAGGLLQRFVDPRGNVTRYAYDDDGNLVKATDPAGGRLQYQRTEFDPQTFEVVKTTSEGRRSRYAVEEVNDGTWRLQNTFPSGLVASVERNNQNFQETRTLPDGTVEIVARVSDPRFGANRILENTTTRTPGGLARRVEMSRTVELADPNDVLSLIEETTVESVNGREWTTTWDALDRTRTTISPEGREIVEALDANGRVIRRQIGDLAPTEVVYDASGRVREFRRVGAQQSRERIFAYDAFSRLDSVVDETNDTTRFDYDGVNRITLQEVADGREVQFGYDPNDNMTLLQPPGRLAHEFSYTPVNLEAVYDPPNISLPDDRTQRFYNSDRDLVRVIRPDGLAFVFGYDRAGRLIAVTTPTHTILMGYDPSTGQRTMIDTSDGINVTRSFDGFLPTGETWSGLVNGSVEVAYDDDFAEASRRVNGAHMVSFAYDDDKLVTQAGAQSIERDFATGLVAATTLGNVADGFTYNDFGELLAYQARVNAALIYDVSFVRDAKGRIVEKTETIDGQTTTYGYAYDETGRLVEVTRDGMAVAQYGYDDNDNRVMQMGELAPMAFGEVDDQDRLLRFGDNDYSYTVPVPKNESIYYESFPVILANVKEQEDTDEKVTLQRRADRSDSSGRCHGRNDGSGALPQARHCRGYLLPLEEQVRRHGGQRRQEAQSPGRGKSAAQADARRYNVGQSSAQGGARKGVVEPKAKRAATTFVMDCFELSQRRACRLTDQHRATQRYESVRDDDRELRDRIVEIAHARRRFGWKRVQMILRREGYEVNHKKTYRIYSEEKLAVRRRRRKRVAYARQWQPRELPPAPNHRWSMDFATDSLANGRRLKVLAVVDECTRECIALVSDTSISGKRVAYILDELIQSRGKPAAIVCDNGPEFTSRALDAWAYHHGIVLDFIQPGKPVQNCYVERFIGSLRDECLHEHWFVSLRHARQILDAWCIDYNRHRPHSSLKGATPKEYAADLLATLQLPPAASALQASAMMKPTGKLSFLVD